jgi:hypothetical protein
MKITETEADVVNFDRHSTRGSDTLLTLSVTGYGPLVVVSTLSSSSSGQFSNPSGVLMGTPRTRGRLRRLSAVLADAFEVLDLAGTASFDADVCGFFSCKRMG